MCGVFFSCSSNPRVLAELRANYPKSIATLERRGPDRSIRVDGSDYIIAHTLLSITGYREQPIVRDGFEFSFNGEIYNDYLNYGDEYSDTDVLTAHFEEFGGTEFDRIDGEYAIIWHDRNARQVVLATDPMGTKPLYYQLGSDHFAAGTYESTVRECGQKGDIVLVPPNTRLVFDVKDFTVVEKTEIRAFHFDRANVDSYQAWTEAFQQALEKRCRNTRYDQFVCLSSGHDSGLIAAEMANLKLPFQAYSVYEGEDRDVLDQRLEWLRARGFLCDVLDPTSEQSFAMHNQLLETLDPFYFENPLNPEVTFPNPDFRYNGGIVAHGLIFEKTAARKQIISIAGSGGDEIYADFDNPYQNPDWSEIKGQWDKVTGPWKNFNGGWLTIFLGGIERVAASFSLEGRYPFLDPDVVQAFLDLSPALKSRESKAPISNRMRELEFPMHDRKFGFRGVDFKLQQASQ